ncbi:MAG: hypothetical protein QNI91_13735 [Arenicellales bacterium]|nr:hypothetical protein [Arenicellales bacterium]
MIERPDIVTDEHLIFLDDLRESGVTNMLGAGQYIIEKFEVDHDQAQTILVYWMKTFTERHEIDQCFGGR